MITMNTDQKLLMISGIQLSAASTIFAAAVLSDDLAKFYRFYEVFPVLMSAFIVTFGLREIRRKT